jgi:SAM-dependent methyltransferase
VRINNPYHRAARRYDRGLSLPLIASLRQQEAQVVEELIATHAAGSATALEIGPGTGFYTLLLAKSVGHVTAVEDSAGMAEILRGKLARAAVSNVDVVNADFRDLTLDQRFDLVVAIGVLDYIAEPEPFVERMCALTRGAVLFTLPQRCFWGTCFAAGNRLRGISVYRYHGDAVPAWADGWRCTVREVGLKTPLTKGLTLVAALERGQ